MWYINECFSRTNLNLKLYLKWSIHNNKLFSDIDSFKNKTYIITNICLFLISKQFKVYYSNLVDFNLHKLNQ